MIKKQISYLILVILLVLVQNVKADSFYYNSGTINLTEKEYNYVMQFYGEEFLKNMSLDDYYWLKELDLNNNDYEIESVTIGNVNSNSGNLILPRSTVVTSNEKKVAISKACSTDYCAITLLTTWLTQPSVKSYDVMGARLYNTSLYNSTITTLVRTPSGTTTQSNYMTYYNGFGNSIQLPTGTINNIEQRFKVNKTGTVYGSYQHAVSNVSLATSKLYNISSSGYGSVFSFYGNAYGKYDNTVGVFI